MNKYLIWLVFLLSSCASMKVQVDLYNRSGLSAEDVLMAAARQAKAMHYWAVSSDLYVDTGVNIQRQLRRYLEDLKSKGVVAPADMDEITSSMERNVRDFISKAVAKRNEGAVRVDEAELMTDADERREAFQSALEDFREAVIILGELRKEIIKWTEGRITQYVQIERPDLEQLDRVRLLQRQKDFENSVSMNLRTLTGGFELFEDPLAPVIISSPEDYWQGIYNKATASGQMGNTDIAIKMETLGTFTIKGLRLDASKVTQASFQVIRQSVRMAAAAYGVPVPVTSAPAVTTSGEGPLSLTEMMMASEKQQNEANKKLRLSRLAALTILETILGEREAMRSVDVQTRQEAIRHIKNTFESYKTQLVGEQ